MCGCALIRCVFLSERRGLDRQGMHQCIRRESWRIGVDVISQRCYPRVGGPAAAIVSTQGSAGQPRGRARAISTLAPPGRSDLPLLPVSRRFISTHETTEHSIEKDSMRIHRLDRMLCLAHMRPPQCPGVHLLISQSRSILLMMFLAEWMPLNSKH
jgi:hypothetical protein